MEDLLYVGAVIGGTGATELLILYSGFLLWIVGLYTVYLLEGDTTAVTSLSFDEGV